AIFVEPAHVAAAVEHRALRAGPEHFRGLLRPVVVAAHHGAGTTDDFTDFPLGQLASIFADDPNLGTFGGLTHGIPLVGVRTAIEAGGDAALGQAIHLPQVARPATHGLGHHATVQGRA